MFRNVNIHLDDEKTNSRNIKCAWCAVVYRARTGDWNGIVLHVMTNFFYFARRRMNSSPNYIPSHPETCTCLVRTSLVQFHDLQCSSIRMSCVLINASGRAACWNIKITKPCSKETRLKTHVDPSCDAERNSEAPTVRPSTSSCTVNVTRCRGTSRDSSPPWRRDIRDNELNEM